MEHYASPDLSGYKAARAQTVSASQVNSVNWGSVVGQNEWARKACLESDWEKRDFSLSLFGCVCFEFIYRTHHSFVWPVSPCCFHLPLEQRKYTLSQSLKKTKPSKYGKVLTMVKTVSTVYLDRRRDKMRRTAGGNEKEKPEERGILWLWEKMTPDRLETMRENARHPLPRNLTKQDWCRPAAAAAASTGGAPPHTIIGFHYAAISLK